MNKGTAARFTIGVRVCPHRNCAGLPETTDVFTIFPSASESERKERDFFCGSDIFENLYCKCYDVIGEKSGSTPEMRKKGNPFLGEELFIHWEKLLNDNPEMTVRLERNYFICCVNLFLGERCLPRKLCICDGKGTELTSYTAETGKSIQEKMLSLPVNETMKTLCIKFDLDLSCLALERIELWGAESDGEALFPIPCHTICPLGCNKCTAYFHCQLIAVLVLFQIHDL